MDTRNSIIARHDRCHVHRTSFDFHELWWVDRLEAGNFDLVPMAGTRDRPGGPPTVDSVVRRVQTLAADCRGCHHALSRTAASKSARQGRPDLI